MPEYESIASTVLLQTVKSSSSVVRLARRCVFMLKGSDRRYLARN
jgi:hypothetical protein